MDTDDCLRVAKSALSIHTHACLNCRGGLRKRELTPPGIKIPSTVSPPWGTTRGVPKGIGGTSRSISLIIAVKYGNVALWLVISLDERYRDRTSCFNFWYTRGVLHSQYVNTLSVVAVVSLPAIIRVLLYEVMCHSLRPIWSLSSKR